METQASLPAEEIERQAPSPSGATIAPPSGAVGPRDRYGRPYDPALHHDPSLLGRRGHLRIKPGRRARGSAPAPGLGASPSYVPPPPSAADAAPDPAVSAAVATVASIVGLASMLGGPHWRADPNEERAMREAWIAYYHARGVTDLPPELALALVMGGYALGHEARRADLARAYARARGSKRPVDAE
jgi:hypothetical protein